MAEIDEDWLEHGVSKAIASAPPITATASGRWVCVLQFRVDSAAGRKPRPSTRSVVIVAKLPYPFRYP